MKLYGVLITGDKWNKEKDELESEIVFGPEYIFAHTKDGAMKKAIIKSGIPIGRIEQVDFKILVKNKKK